MAGSATGIYLCDNGGWTKKDSGLSTAAKAFVRDIAVCPHNRDIIIATTADGVYRTTDRGENWSKLSMPDGDSYWGVAFDTATPGRVIIAGIDVGSYPNPDPKAARSTDYGASWSSIDLPTQSV